jgi:hypothetical protein
LHADAALIRKSLSTVSDALAKFLPLGTSLFHAMRCGLSLRKWFF